MTKKTTTVKQKIPFLVMGLSSSDYEECWKGELIEQGTYFDFLEVVLAPSVSAAAEYWFKENDTLSFNYIGVISGNNLTKIQWFQVTEEVKYEIKEVKE
jgi:hypothetical protein